MILTFASHADALKFAAALLPRARWVHAEGDVGQTHEDDVALEDRKTDVSILLSHDGTATVHAGNLSSLNPQFRIA